MVQQSDEIVHEELDGVDSVGDVAFAVSPHVVRNRADIVGQCLHLRFPHQVAERKPVNEDHRKALREASLRIIHGKAVELHFHFRPPSLFSKNLYTSSRISVAALGFPRAEAAFRIRERISGFAINSLNL